MATVTSTMAAAVGSNSTHRPSRAAENAKMHSILAAAIGLTTLNTSSSPSQDSSPSSPLAVDQVPTQARDFRPPSMTLTPALTNPSIARTTMRPDLETSMLTLQSARPSPRYLATQAPYSSAPYPDRSSVGAARTAALNTTSSPWLSSIRSQQSGFESLPPMTLNHSTSSLSSAAIASMDRFSLVERVAALDRATAASTSAAASPYSSRYPMFPPYQEYGAGNFGQFPSMSYQAPPTIPNTKNFPETLFDIISMDKNSHIVSWLHHGKGFIIHDKQRFASLILPQYFDGAKFTSFTRRLKRWSFVRVPRGPELGSYYNKNFVRDLPELVVKMRYRMEGHFEEGKKKTGQAAKEEADNKEDMDVETLKEEIEKEVEKKLEESLPKKEEVAQVKSESPSLTSQEKLIIQQQKSVALPVKIPSVDLTQSYSADPQEHPMPLPSTLPKRPREATISHTGNVNLRVLSSEDLRELAAANANKSAILSRAHPPVVTHNDPVEQRLFAIQREMLLARSMMPLDTLALSRTGSPNRISGLPSALPTNAQSLPSQSLYNTAPSHALGRIEAEHAKRLLDVERVLSNQGATPARILSSSKSHEETMVDAAIQDLKLKLQAPTLGANHRAQQQRSSSWAFGGGASSQLSERHQNIPLSTSYDNLKSVSKNEFSARELNMAREAIRQSQSSGTEQSFAIGRNQEKEFAEYLFMKRESMKALRMPNRDT